MKAELEFYGEIDNALPEAYARKSLDLTFLFNRHATAEDAVQTAEKVGPRSIVLLENLGWPMPDAQKVSLLDVLNIWVPASIALQFHRRAINEAEYTLLVEEYTSRSQAFIQWLENEEESKAELRKHYPEHFLKLASLLLAKQCLIFPADMPEPTIQSSGKHTDLYFRRDEIMEPEITEQGLNRTLGQEISVRSKQLREETEL